MVNFVIIVRMLKEKSKGIYDLCEECYCEQAKDNYVLENDLDYEE